MPSIRVHSRATAGAAESMYRSQAAGAASVPQPVPPNPGALPEPTPWRSAPHLIGLKGFDRAATSRACCGVCRTAIPAGTWRLDFRFKAGRSLSDQRRVHPFCIQRTPNANRADDLRVVRLWLARPGLEQEAYAVLEQVFTALSGPSGASSSAGP